MPTYRTRKARSSAQWRELKERAKRRSNGRCEFCGKPCDSGHLHHRWYPESDTTENLMIVHSLCHHAIHFGGSVKALKGSLAALGDNGKRKTSLWVKYLDGMA